MDTLKQRFCIRITDGGAGNALQQVLPLASTKTLYRVFIQFLIGDIHSLEIFREDYFDKKVMSKERKNGVLVRGEGQTLRNKILGHKGYSYDALITKFREGLFNPEKDGVYEGCKVGAGLTITQMDDELFESSVEILTSIHEETYTPN